MNAIAKFDSGLKAQHSAPAESEYLSFVLDGQHFGISVLTVQDVLNARDLARIPLAPNEVAGALNLRGRIVTAIDMRRRMGLSPKDLLDRHMSIVVDHDGELYSLVVDAVGDVLRLSSDTFEPNPATFHAHWRELSLGVHRLKEHLLIILDVERLLTIQA
jgi:purine-binding chemotaxis protein CheW